MRWRILERLPHVSEVLVNVAAVEGKQCPMLATLRSAEDIESDVRANIARLEPLPPSPPSSTSTAETAAAAAAAAAAVTATATADPAILARIATATPAPSSSSSSSSSSSAFSLMTQRVTVHYLGMRPCVEILIDHPSSSIGGSDQVGDSSRALDEGVGRHEEELPLATVRRMAEQVRQAAEEVPDVFKAEVHLCLTDVEDHKDGLRGSFLATKTSEGPSAIVTEASVPAFIGGIE